VPIVPPAPARFDDDRLAQGDAQLGRHGARQDVLHAAGREGHDDAFDPGAARGGLREDVAHGG
jgi:hypothetical protein